MPGSQAGFIHPSAIISHEAKLAENVKVGPFVVIEGPVTVGEGTVIHPHAHLIGPMIIGMNNQIHTGALLGGNPQHLGYMGEATSVEIGEGNIIREYVTIDGAMPAGA